MLSEWQHKPLTRAILHWVLFIAAYVLALVRPKLSLLLAYKLARIFYRLWTSGGNYQDPGMDDYEQRYQERVINNLQRKALALSFELIPQPEASTVS